jgi:hypothetical protein
MTKTTFRQQGGFRLGLIGKLVILLILASFLGCVAAVVPIIYYAETHKGFVVTAQLDVEADKVYQAALEVIENPPKESLPGLIEVKNIKKDEKGLSVTFDAVFEDGTHEDKIKVTSIGGSRSQLVATADTPGKTEADQSSALKIVRLICDKLGVKYTLVKG